MDTFVNMNFGRQLADIEAEQSGELSAERLADLRWMTTSQFAIPVLEKHELAMLLDAYEAGRQP